MCGAGVEVEVVIAGSGAHHDFEARGCLYDCGVHFVAAHNHGVGIGRGFKKLRAAGVFFKQHGLHAGSLKNLTDAFHGHRGERLFGCDEYFHGLFVLGFEIVHGFYEEVHAFHGQGVVERCAEAAHAAVALDAHYASLRAEVDEVFLEFFERGRHYECDVHERAVFHAGRALEHRAGVDGFVEPGGLEFGAALQLVDAADFLVVAQRLQGGEDGQHGRSVEHRAFLDMGAVVEHGGDGSVDTAERFLFDDYERNTCRGEVFLRSCVDGVVACHVDRARENVGAHVGDEGAGCVGVFAQFGAVYGVVGGDVEVVESFRHGISVGVERVAGRFAGGEHVDVAEQACFLYGVVGPCAGVEVARAAAQEVVRYHGELHRRSAPEP